MKEFFKKFIPSFLLNFYHFILSLLGAIFYRFPSKKIKVIGVAGTDGKSTVVELSSKILEEAGYKIASSSSIKFKIGDKEWKNTLKMTMPGRLKLQRFLRQAVNNQCQYAVLEVTDEGIKQYRHRFIDFDVAVLTNLTPEHIEAHGSFEKMREMNRKLFQVTKNIHIINIDDENSEYFLKVPSNQKFCYSANENLDIKSLKIDLISPLRERAEENLKFIKADNVKISNKGIEFVVDNTCFHLNLLGGFNVSNSLAAIGVGLSQGINLEICKLSLEKTEGTPGRMEVIIREPFTVIVDYAHTVTALQKVYETIENWKLKIENSRTICVLGSCGGGRDKWKRPAFGEIAAKYCNQIILTNEDPYNENPQHILNQIESGFSQIPNSKFQIPKYEKILDRREAIKKALRLAKPNDTVVITGKGCEPWICIADGKKIPWDDRQIVREEFKNLRLN